MHCGELHGGKASRERICVAGLFCCPVETNITLQSNYTPIKITGEKKINIV